MRLFAFICAAMLALPVAANDRASGGQKIWFSSSEEIREGASLIDSGQIEKGIEVTRDAMKTDLSISDIAAGYNNLCTADIARAQYDSAMEKCQRALRIKKNMPEPLNNIGNIHFFMGDYQTAVDFYKRALRSRPLDDQIMGNLMLAQRRLKGPGTSPSGGAAAG